MELTKEQVAGLRNVPVEDARDALRSTGLKSVIPTKKIYNAIDVAMYEFNFKYPDAVQMLAELFPEAIRAGEDTGISSFKTAMELAEKKAQQKGVQFKKFGDGNQITIMRKSCFKWWGALQLDHIHIKTAMDSAVKSHDNYPYQKRNVDLADLFIAIPALLHNSMAGSLEHPVHMYCTPVWKENRAGIMVNDAKPDLIKTFPPSAVIATSDRSAQAFYVLEKKQDDEFYHFLMKTLNRMYGDPNVTRMNHDTRLPGFQNQKAYSLVTKNGEKNFPRCKVLSANSNYPFDLENYAFEEIMPLWVEEITQKKLDADTNRSRRKLGFACTTYVPPDRPVTKAEYMSQLECADLPEWVIECGEKAKVFFRQYLAEKKDMVKASDVDANIARYLHAICATGDEIYTYLLNHSCQFEMCANDEWIRKRDGEARQTTANMAPAYFVSDGWISKNPNAVVVWEKKYPELFQAIPPESMERSGQLPKKMEYVSFANNKERDEKLIIVDWELNEFGCLAQDLW